MTAPVAEHMLALACPPDDVSAVHEFLAGVWQHEPSVAAEDGCVGWRGGWSSWAAPR